MTICFGAMNFGQLVIDCSEFIWYVSRDEVLFFPVRYDWSFFLCFFSRKGRDTRVLLDESVILFKRELEFGITLSDACSLEWVRS